MTAQLSPIDVPCVCVADGIVHIDRVVSSDADLVALVAEAADPVDVVCAFCRSARGPSRTRGQAFDVAVV